ncbi:TetR/AcrR family transcriptional regulator [Rathayibacter tanaceti]|uniref:HTH-type transcriptional repressor KstR n=2 Tax=Rathayibacter tanaceti TaxID=1671680 RepID=A0A162J1H2_9MICO|nr:TetR/AcrR family transcriptional regulator [Rathayibacter tanaceti]KZX20807.1 HTH-type transcriptional repressor KstR [Rathayibacter tanaceti]QHC56923.1 TetR family transcriptional regulator [Rathayibacter tanaceti]TCO38423.1 TetR family transcriptional regulator [Rathayibacter tanaceti]
MESEEVPQGRRERAKEDKRRRIADAARELFAERGVGGVTTQQIADRADVAIGTLYLYAATKAELLIMVQNRTFAAAIDDGLAASGLSAGALDQVLALVTPVVSCLREQPENGRTYLHELVFGDPAEPWRREGLTLSMRLEEALRAIVVRDARLNDDDAAPLARVITSIIHLTTTATLHLEDPLPVILGHIRRQIGVVLRP